LNSEQFIPVLTKGHLNKICRDIGINENGLNSLQKNREILEYFRENEISKEWHTCKISSFCYSKYGFDLKEKDEKKNVSVGNAYGDDLLNLLLKKSQIILYGPPGTGKTYITKRMTVDFIEHVNVLNDLIEYEELPSAGGDQEIREVDNILFNKLKNMINTLLEVEAVPRTSMVGYYSISRITNRKKGLVWVGYPSPTTSSFTVHLRKENNTNKYPQEILNQLANYRSNGWGGYPVFTVNNEGDVENAIELIRYAYENL
jgi:shikimate kinase